MRSENEWVFQYLPNAEGAPSAPPGNVRRSPAAPSHGVRMAAEFILRTAPVEWLENWEMNRKVRRFGREADDETMFSADWCKGHFEHHGRRAMEAYSRRWHELSSDPEGDV